jgi:hypothetical protein
MARGNPTYPKPITPKRAERSAILRFNSVSGSAWGICLSCLMIPFTSLPRILLKSCSATGSNCFRASFRPNCAEDFLLLPSVLIMRLTSAALGHRVYPCPSFFRMDNCFWAGFRPYGAGSVLPHLSALVICSRAIACTSDGALPTGN